MDSMAKIKLDKLKKEFDKKYQNSSLSELVKLEKEKKTILDSVGGLNVSEDAINHLQNTLASSAFKEVFKTANDYAKYTNPLLKEIKQKDYLSLQQQLDKSISPYIKTEVKRATEALDYVGKTLSELDKSTYHHADKYRSDISSALKEVDINNNLLADAKSLTESMKKIETDMFQDKMDRLNERRLEIPKMMEPINIPENLMIKQNSQMIKLLDTQKETLISIGQYISSQNEKLDTQNKIVEQEIKNNKESAKQAFWTAIASIVIAILATFGAIFVSYNIYDKEDKSSNIQHTELLQSINKNNKLDLIKKQTEVLNNILKAVEHQNINEKIINKNK